MPIINTTRNTILAQHYELAQTFSLRLVGLLKKKSLATTEALVIPRCQCIHMFFMRFPIDAIFLDRQNRVVGLVRNLKPFRMSPVFLKASCVIELVAGAIEKSQTHRGDIVNITS